jgi:hypothetical protein
MGIARYASRARNGGEKHSVMRPIVVLGGYGRVGRLCVSELAARTRAPLRIAGRNAQRAQSLALSIGERASPTYSDAGDSRVLLRTFEGAAAVVACCGGDLVVPLQCALELRVPFVGLSPVPLAARSQTHVAELAWKAQVPVVLHAGALPGIPGLLAESLVRRVTSIRRLRIASTGPFTATETAERDQRAQRMALAEAAPRRARRFPEVWRFSEPIGRRAVGTSTSADLVGFAESHTVDELEYLEPRDGTIARAVARVVTRSASPGFAVAARAFAGDDEREPTAELEVTAPDILALAAAVSGALAAAMLDGRVPAGLSSAREALPPALLLGELEKRGARVRLTAARG